MGPWVSIRPAPALSSLGGAAASVSRALIGAVTPIAGGAAGHTAPVLLSPAQIGQAAPAQPLQVLRGDLFHKAGGAVGAGPSKKHPLIGAGEVQLLLGPCHGHIAQPPLLLHLLRFPNGPDAGEDALLGPHHKDHRELQPLGRVHGHHHHAVLVRVVAV